MKKSDHIKNLTDKMFLSRKYKDTQKKTPTKILVGVNNFKLLVTGKQQQVWDVWPTVHGCWNRNYAYYRLLHFVTGS